MGSANAGAYIVEGFEEGHSVYRIVHRGLADYLRDRHAPTREQRERSHSTIVDVLLEQVPTDTSGKRDWFRAHPYVTRHFATHAARAGAG